MHFMGIGTSWIENSSPQVVEYISQKNSTSILERGKTLSSLKIYKMMYAWG